MKLSEREKWLMSEAFKCGVYSSNNTSSGYKNINDWLDDMVADGVTVEMLLVKEIDEWEMKE